MCAICGIIDFDKNIIDKNELINFRDSMSHRGRDGKGSFYCNNVAFGSRRLSIFDLTEHGNQPIIYNDRYVIVYNGEVYNFQQLRNELEDLGYLFKTKTDTEVVLVSYIQWGIECQNKFNGMWSFAIYDKVTKETIISRDRLGIKPLYYFSKANRFAFASEIKAFVFLKKNPPEIDNDRLAMLGLYWEDESTFLKDVKSLQGGHYISIKDNIVKKKKWWFKEKFKTQVYNKYEDNFEKLKFIIENSLKEVLKSDTKIAYSLSGGFDSYLLYCFNSLLANKEKNLIATNNFFFNIFYNGEKNLYPNKIINELQNQNQSNIYSQEINKKFLTYDSLVKDIIYHEDISEPAIGPFVLYSNMSTKGFKVSIDGHGLDELFGGYNEYIMTALIENIFSPFYFYKLLKNFNNIYPNQYKKNLIQIIKNFVKFRILKKRKKLNIMQLNQPNLFNHEKHFNEQEFSCHLENFSNLDSQCSYDMSFGSMRKVLTKFDKISMSYGVESRVPFLDWRLVSFTEACKSKFKIYDKNKRMPKDMMLKYFPNKNINKIFDNHKKFGFDSREDWFVKNFNGFVKETIYSDDFGTIVDFCNTANLRKLYKNNINNYSTLKKIYRFCQVYHLKKFLLNPSKESYER